MKAMATHHHVCPLLLVRKLIFFLISKVTFTFRYKNMVELVKEQIKLVIV